MRCRNNIRKLIVDYNAAAAPDQPNTDLGRFRQALVLLKSAPSRLAPPHTQASNYDDYVYIHQQSMAGHPTQGPGSEGPHSGHRGPNFFPWHREFLRQFENDLRAVSANPDLCLPYWDWSVDQGPVDPGYPFIAALLGGNGDGTQWGVVPDGVFSHNSGWILTLDDNFNAGNNPGQALQRDLGGGTGNLPPRNTVINALAVSEYDVAPWNIQSAGAHSFRNQVEGWANGLSMHNRVHVWVGGSMLPSTSPNDPVFFLNHAKEDQLWAVWMQKYPAVPHFLPNDSEPIPAGHSHLKRLSDHMDSLAEYFGGTTLDRPIDLLDHKAITWYDTDLPEISLESGPALGFNNTPAGLTAARLIRLRVYSCRRVFVSVTGAPGGNFSVVGGPDFNVNPLSANPSEILEIEVRFHAVGANVQVSAVDLEVRVTDVEGYYAANAGDPYTVTRLHIDLVANNIITSDSSVALVLDRSGSMGDVANNGFTKSQLLKNAVGVMHELMQDNDQIGIARFDDVADALLPMTLKSAGLGTTLTGTGLDPRGGTSIGAGILIGSGLINGTGATRPNKAMVVLTDGNENVDPLIGALPAGTINQTTFAVGFGLPGQVSDPVLHQIALNSGGYLLVTGNMTSDAERFSLAKLFIQILKDASRSQTVIDPPGLLGWGGAEQEIPFPLSDTDVTADIVVLCPIPWALTFELRTPTGIVINAGMSGVEPNVRYVVGHDVVYYRLLLPALPSNAAGSHRGLWKAVLRLPKIDEIWQNLKIAGDRNPRFQEMLVRVRELAEGPVPYQLTAHTYSNLMLDATLRQDSFAVGATIHLDTRLWEYEQLLASEAQVWAEVRDPGGVQNLLPFVRQPDRTYRAETVATRSGIYSFLIRAQGRTSGGSRFERQKTLTAGVWAGGDRPYNPQTGSNGDSRSGAECCDWMSCMLEQAAQSKLLRARLEEFGIDVDALLKCMDRTGGRTVNASNDMTKMPADPQLRQLAELPEFRRLMALATSVPPPSPAVEAVRSTPVDRKPKRSGNPDNMFVRPEEAVEIEQRLRLRKAERNKD